MSYFAEMLARSLADGNSDSNTPRMSKIGQVARLREFEANYAVANTFKVGDLVTPREGGNVKDAGEPHVVVETREAPIFNFDGQTASSGFGRRLNIRVALISEHGPVCFWGEHHAYELYTGDGSRPGDLSAAAA